MVVAVVVIDFVRVAVLIVKCMVCCEGGGEGGGEGVGDGGGGQEKNHQNQ